MNEEDKGTPNPGPFPSVDTLSAIGRLVMTSGMVEMVLHLQVQRLISHPNGISPLAVSALHGSNVAVLCAQLHTLVGARINSEEDQRGIQKKVARIRKLFDRRNDIVHGFLTGTNGGVHVHRIRLKGGVVQQNFDISCEEIEGLSIEMDKTSFSLDQHLTKLGIAKLQLQIPRHL